MDLAAGLPSFLNIKKLVGQALDNIFRGFQGLIEPHLFQITYQSLSDAIDEGFGKVEYGHRDYAFVQQLKKSGAWFAARKTYRQREELAALLVDENGKTRTFRQFKAASQAIVQNYNEVWLKTEYNTAIASARNASRWRQFEADRHLYPNLEYLPSRAATPRDEHKPYYHVVRPIDDDFWVRHYPPSAFNCKCGVEQSDGNPTPVPVDGPAPAPGLDHNVGQTGELYSRSHPYSADLSDKKLEEIDHAGEDALANTDVYDVVYTSPSGHRLRLHPTHNPAEIEENVAYGRILTDLKKQVDLRSYVPTGRKNPDATVDGIVFDFKKPKKALETNLVDALKQLIKDAGAQVKPYLTNANGGGVLLDLRDRNLSINDTIRVLNGAITPDRNRSIDHVWLLHSKKRLIEINRNEILNRTYYDKL